jgi:hypothetical protein
MVYDPTPLPAGDSLTVQVEGARGKPDQLYVLGRPRDGVVEVREQTFGETCAPREYAERADALLRRFERASRDRRRVSVELYALRRWLAADG